MKASLSFHWLPFLAIAAFVICLRLPSWGSHYAGEDEGLYFTVAQDAVSGGVPYVTSWDHKGPALYYWLALPALFWKASVLAQRVFATLTLLLTMGLLHALAKGRWLPPLLYGCLFSLTPEGLESNGELIGLLPVTASLVCLGRGGRWLFWAGAAAGLAALLKWNLLLCLTPLLLRKWRTREGALFLGGGVFVGAAVILALGIQGALEEFHFAYWRFNLLFGSSRFRGWAALALGGAAAAAWLSRRSGEETRFKLVFTLGCLAAVLAPGRFFPHYLLLMAAPLALWIPWAPKRLWPVAAAAALLLAPFQWNGFLRMREKSARSDFTRVAEYLRAGTSPGEPVFVMEGRPLVYFLADRPPATPYFWRHFYKGPRAAALARGGKEPLRPVLQNPPALVAAQRRPPRPHDGRLLSLLAERYRKTASIGRFDVYRRNDVRPDRNPFP